MSANVRMSQTTSDSAGVRFPPPLAYLAGLIAGVLLGRVLPGSLPHTLALTVAGIALILSGLSLVLFSAGLFRQRGTNINPTRPSTILVTDGPYRFTRNPMYVGLVLIYAGIALLLASLWALLVLVPVLVIIRYLVIAKEERYLLKKFGGEYRTFTGRVRRWI
jgi:protein-S-isoprenylcysteine O-methyltransferase Ste14